jgi:methylphosphotriester-DNA--protein-cysteine methyltransferase
MLHSAAATCTSVSSMHTYLSLLLLYNVHTALVRCALPTKQISVEEEKVAKITRAIESEKQKMLQKAKAKSSKEEVCVHRLYTVLVALVFIQYAHETQRVQFGSHSISA